MKLCKKSFLLIVGVITIAMDEVQKAIGEASEAVEKETLKKQQTK